MMINGTIKDIYLFIYKGHNGQVGHRGQEGKEDQEGQES